MGLGASSRQTLVLATGVSGGLLIGAQFARWSSADEALGLFRNDHPRIASDELRSGYKRREPIMAILDQVDAARLGPEVRETSALMRRDMTPVVDDDIEFTKASKKSGVGLIADMYLETGLLEVALLANVDTDNRGARAEVLFPDLERTAVVDTDFEDPRRFALVFR